MEVTMESYYVRIKQQSFGYNSVHKEDCFFLPNIEDRKYLGEFNSCKKAVRLAKSYFPEVTGCIFCCEECTDLMVIGKGWYRHYCQVMEGISSN
jgi:hypothetical protein